MPVHHEKKLLFVHVPKTGGTTILTLLGLWQSQRTPNFATLFGDLGALDLQHLTLSQAAQFLTPEEFGQYYKFAFVRNPWDRAVSAALWRARYGVEPVRDLRDFVDWAERVIRDGPQKPSDSHALPQAAFLKGPGGYVEIDRLGRFETFADDLKRMLEAYVTLPNPLPHKLRHDRRSDYREHYHGDLRERVAQLYAEDAWRFDYQF